MTHRTISAEEARALREAATPGPWRHANKRSAHVVASECIVHRIDLETDWQATPLCRPRWIADAALIAAAPDLAATVEALHAEVERLRAQNGELRSALQDYLDNDDTNEGGKWEESNAPWLAIKRRAAALLAALERAP
jgi:hypothetical protein